MKYDHAALVAAIFALVLMGFGGLPLVEALLVGLILTLTTVGVGVVVAAGK